MLLWICFLVILPLMTLHAQSATLSLYTENTLLIFQDDRPPQTISPTSTPVELTMEYKTILNPEKHSKWWFIHTDMTLHYTGRSTLTFETSSHKDLFIQFNEGRIRVTTQKKIEITIPFHLIECLEACDFILYSQKDRFELIPLSGRLQSVNLQTLYTQAIKPFDQWKWTEQNDPQETPRQSKRLLKELMDTDVPSSHQPSLSNRAQLIRYVKEYLNQTQPLPSGSLDDPSYNFLKFSWQFHTLLRTPQMASSMTALHQQCLALVSYGAEHDGLSCLHTLHNQLVSRDLNVALSLAHTLRTFKKNEKSFQIWSDILQISGLPKPIHIEGFYEQTLNSIQQKRYQKGWFYNQYYLFYAPPNHTYYVSSLKRAEWFKNRRTFQQILGNYQWSPQNSNIRFSWEAERNLWLSSPPERWRQGLKFQGQFTHIIPHHSSKPADSILDGTIYWPYYVPESFIFTNWRMGPLIGGRYLPNKYSVLKGGVLIEHQRSHKLEGIWSYHQHTTSFHEIQCNIQFSPSWSWRKWRFTWISFQDTSFFLAPMNTWSWMSYHGINLGYVLYPYVYVNYSLAGYWTYYNQHHGFSGLNSVNIQWLLTPLFKIKSVVSWMTSLTAWAPTPQISLEASYEF